ncbi:hypothetical protein DFH09DRAFT_1130568 [Mycena vulgaris]|nr:hypothetical protein DFH09DRAFT_1130568 [Mycena vulgaris]
MSARIFTSSVLRSARPLAVYHAHLPRRTLFGFGAKPPSPPSGTPPIDEAELAKTKEMVQGMFKDKPDAVNAVIKFAKVMEESGLRRATRLLARSVDEHFFQGLQYLPVKCPGPIQLMKLATNPKFRDAYKQVQDELKNAGVDISSKEFIDEMMKVAKQLPRGS